MQAAWHEEKMVQVASVAALQRTQERGNSSCGAAGRRIRSVRRPPQWHSARLLTVHSAPVPKRNLSELEYMDWGVALAHRLKKQIQRIVRKHSIAKQELAVSYFLFVKALKSLRATRTLWAAGLTQDAVVIVRCIFELYVQMLYLGTSPGPLTARYMAYYLAFERDISVGMIKTSARDDPWLNRWKDSAQIYGSAAKVAARRVGHDFDDGRGWSGKSLRDIVRLLEKKGHRRLWADYEFFYPISSALVHSTVSSMRAYLANPQANCYRELSHRRSYFSDVPLLACSWSLVVGMVCALEHSKMGRDYDLARAISDVKQYLETVHYELER